MTEISICELYELYLDTIAKCTSGIYNLSDEEILYNLFEEFDAGAHSFLHVDNLAKLYQGGLIDEETAKASKAIRERWLVLQNQSWTVDEIRKRKEWEELFELCDYIMSRKRRV